MTSNKIAFTVDLDDWYHTPLVAGANFSHYPDVPTFFREWKGRYDYITAATHRLLDMLDRHHVRATFFVIADQVERYPEIMQRLKTSGHEIAHHSLHHTIPFNTQTREETQSQQQWEAELILARTILEDFFETPVTGYRAPGAYFADWMIPLLIKHGFRYDSSVVSNSVYNKSNRDLKHFPKTPFWLDTDFGVAKDAKNALLEIPWVSRKVGPLYLPGGGAFFFRLLGARYFIGMLRQHLKQGDGVFYIHSLDLCTESIPLGNFRNRPFYWINKGEKTVKALDKLLRAFPGQFCTCEEIVQRHG